jgi:penicillin-binding protein 1A
MPRVLPAALGAVDTTVLRMAGGYAGLSQGGKEVVPTLIETVQDRYGTVVWRAPGTACDGCDNAAEPPTLTDQRAQVADPASVFQVVTMLQGVATRGTGARASAGLNRPIAGKTGTTQDFNDAWFIGFTPDLVTAVWLGFDTPISLGEKETGGALAAPIWHDFMAIALKNHPVLSFPAPPGVNLVKWDTGYGAVTDAFKPGTEPGTTNTDQWLDGGFAGGGGGGGGGAAVGDDASRLDNSVGGLY